jgi:uncharacterized membrane protein
MLIGAATAVLFASAAWRHSLFRSTAYDLGIFDQALYLISRGEVPHSSLLGYHILGDHVAWILYPMSALYLIVATPYWLLLVQAAALAAAAWPLYCLARQASLDEADALTLASAYLLYPIVYNQSVADFHPEVIAVPAMLLAVLAARAGRVFVFTGSVVTILACKEILGFTVAAMGLWLWRWEKRPAYGAGALLAGAAWCGWTIAWAIPSLTGIGQAETVSDGRYAYLGHTFAEFFGTAVARPWEPLAKVLSLAGVAHVINLALPVLWGLAPGHLAPLVGALPTAVLNLLSEWSRQRHVTNWYSLPSVPFLMLAVLSAMAAGRTWIGDRRVILFWCAVAFLAFSRYPRLAVFYLDATGAESAARQAIALVESEAGVLTDNCMASHLAHRRRLYVLGMNPRAQEGVRDDVDYVLLNRRSPCSVEPGPVRELARALTSSRAFGVEFEQDGIVLLRRAGRRPQWG